MAQALLKAVNITKSFAGVQALKGVSLEIMPGEVHCLAGENGCGKSTLAKHFNSILLPTGGKVYVCGIDTSNEERILQVRRNVGMVFQNPDNQIVANVVEEDVAFGPENLGISSPEIRHRVNKALKQVGMYNYREHAPHLLSGGQKQRVAIAGIIAMEPKCIILDEPTAMLDPRGRREVVETIGRLNKEKGITIVVAEQKIMLLCEYVKKLIVLEKGTLIHYGEIRSTLTHQKEMEEAGINCPRVLTLTSRMAEEGLVPDSYTKEDRICLNAEECAAFIRKVM